MSSYPNPMILMVLLPGLILGLVFGLAIAFGIGAWLVMVGRAVWEGIRWLAT